MRPYQWILQFWNSMDKMDQIKWSGAFWTCEKKHAESKNSFFHSLWVIEGFLFVVLDQQMSFSSEFVIQEIIYKIYRWSLEVPSSSNNSVIHKHSFPKNDLWHPHSQDLGKQWDSSLAQSSLWPFLDCMSNEFGNRGKWNSW